MKDLKGISLDNNIHEFLKNERVRQNISQLDMAKRLKVSQTVLSYVETGAQKISFRLIFKVCEILNLEIRLLRGKGKKQEVLTIENFFEFIREERLSKNITLGELAALGEKSRHSITSLEMGRVIPSIYSLNKIYKALNLEVKIFKKDNSKKSEKVVVSSLRDQLANEYIENMFNLKGVFQQNWLDFKAGWDACHIHLSKEREKFISEFNKKVEGLKLEAIK